MNNLVIAIPSQSFVITTIVYALLVPVFFEMDNAFGEENFVDDVDTFNTSSLCLHQLINYTCCV
jgi:hypothetical protein